MTDISVGKMIWKSPPPFFGVNGVITVKSKLMCHLLNEISSWNWRVEDPGRRHLTAHHHLCVRVCVCKGNPLSGDDLRTLLIKGQQGVTFQIKCASWTITSSICLLSSSKSCHCLFPLLLFAAFLTSSSGNLTLLLTMAAVSQLVLVSGLFWQINIFLKSSHDLTFFHHAPQIRGIIFIRAFFSEKVVTVLLTYRLETVGQWLRRLISTPRQMSRSLERPWREPVSDPDTVALTSSLAGVLAASGERKCNL